MKIVFLQPNIFDIDRIAFLETWPKEFDQYFKIDNKTLFEKTVYEEIRRIYNSVGWQSFNPSDGYKMSLFDILNLG